MIYSNDQILFQTEGGAILQKFFESPIPVLTIYATVLSNRDICKVKIVCEDGLEINLPDQMFLGKKRMRTNRSQQNRVSYLLKGKKRQIVHCKCGAIINQGISILQCPKCLNRSLPSILKQKLEENETNEFWQKLKEAFDQNKGQ